MVGSAGILPAGFGILPNPVIQRTAKCSRKGKVQPSAAAWGVTPSARPLVRPDGRRDGFVTGKAQTC